MESMICHCCAGLRGLPGNIKGTVAAVEHLLPQGLLLLESYGCPTLTVDQE